jgi:hypothetical protein
MDELKNGERFVYVGGVITFKAGDEIETSNIILANLSRTAFSFEFRWNRKTILYTITCNRNGLTFEGTATYILRQKRIPFVIVNASFIEPLIFAGIWIEDSLVWEFSINFTSCSLVKEE